MLTLEIISYKDNLKDIILIISTSFKDWKVVLIQILEDHRKLYKYKSNFWNKLKVKYNINK